MKMTKILKISEINKLSKKIKKEKKKIVLCHGVFDLVHLGHINYFKSSKYFGDILVVSVTKGRFVNKGFNRPYNSDEDRVNFLTSLNTIDYVVLNDKPTSVNIIKLLKPDFYAKGPDYKNIKKDITGEIKNEIKAVKSIKGKVIFTDDRSLSSSKILNKLDNSFDNNQKIFLKSLKSKFNFNYINYYLEKIKSIRTSVIGEIIVDKYIFCDTVGKSGKEPHLVLKDLYEEKYLGGAGAIANNLALLCKKVKFISYIGKFNSQSKFIKKRLNLNILKNFIIKKNSPTIEKKRFIDNVSKSKIIGVYNMNENNLDKFEEKNINDIIKQSLQSSDLFIISDYGHGLINSNTAKILTTKKKFIALNAQLNAFNIGYHTLTKYNFINFLIINENELRHELRDRSSSIEILIEKINKKIKIDNLVITRGKNGAVYYSKKKNFKIYCPAFANNVLDKVGAGDTMLSVMSLLCKVDCDPRVSIFLGSLAAAQNVENLNNSCPLDKTKLLQYANYMLK